MHIMWCRHVMHMIWCRHVSRDNCALNNVFVKCYVGLCRQDSTQTKLFAQRHMHLIVRKVIFTYNKRA